MSSSYAFLTGATGFVGSMLALELLERTDLTLVALVRAPDWLAAHERLHSALHEAALLYRREDLIPAIYTRTAAIAGDLLDGKYLASISHFGAPRECWHCAASLDFEIMRAADTFQTNFTGTRMLAQAMKSWGVKRFFYMSTAYVAGRRTGLIRETAPRTDAGFHNSYEESKAATEVMLLEELKGDVFILRPSIVLGDSRTYKSASTTAFYGFMREIYKVNRTLARRGMSMPPLAIFTHCDAVFSLIPVDRLCADAVSISRSSTRDRIFHLTRRSTRTAGGNIALVCEVFGLPEPKPTRMDQESHRVNRILASKFAAYQPYVSGSKVFLAEHTERITGRPEEEFIDALPYVQRYREQLEEMDAMHERSAVA